MHTQIKTIENKTNYYKCPLVDRNSQNISKHLENF